MGGLCLALGGRFDDGNVEDREEFARRLVDRLREALGPRIESGGLDGVSCLARRFGAFFDFLALFAPFCDLVGFEVRDAAVEDENRGDVVLEELRQALDHANEVGDLLARGGRIDRIARPLYCGGEIPIEPVVGVYRHRRTSEFRKSDRLDGGELAEVCVSHWWS